MPIFQESTNKFFETIEVKGIDFKTLKIDRGTKTSISSDTTRKFSRGYISTGFRKEKEEDRPGKHLNDK